MSKHTPAPWTIEENEMMGRDIVSAAGRALICTQVYSPDDACMIAAAPDLLAALEKAMRVYGVDMQPAHRYEFRAAIAKATGGEA